MLIFASRGFHYCKRQNEERRDTTRREISLLKTSNLNFKYRIDVSARRKRDASRSSEERDEIDVVASRGKAFQTNPRQRVSPSEIYGIGAEISMPLLT